MQGIRIEGKPLDERRLREEDEAKFALKFSP